MRLNRFDLIRYGKFSERFIDLPASRRDFHLIVGPNEAGKSTVCSGIIDLLFGFHKSSPFAFHHALNELRVGASITNKSGSLDFQRAKAQKQTLRSPDDAVLSDTVLSSFLGSADRVFFEQMFGLDHARLVQGGKSILSAENDVGQVLFQSAVGVASLGIVRDALMKEADALWAPRASGSRAYYVGAELLDAATAALKAATLRTKIWVEANGNFERVEETLSAERAGLKTMQDQRSGLERIRRTAPFLQALRECEKKLAELGVVIDLPADAAATLARAEQAIATGEELFKQRSDEVKKATESMSNIVIDETVLAVAGQIDELAQMRVQYGTHERDIGLRETEILLSQMEIHDICAQLGWQRGSEEVLLARLPTPATRRELGDLARESSGMEKAFREAKKAETVKTADIAALAGRINALSVREIATALRAALAKGRSLGDPELTGLRQLDAQNKARTASVDAFQALGKWIKPESELLAMHMPTEATLSRMLQERQSLVSDRKVLVKQQEEQEGEVRRIALEISQYKEIHHPTTLEAVVDARRERDAAWVSIRSASIGLDQASPAFEEHIRHSDHLADARFDDVEEATVLQSRQQSLERERLGLIDLGEQLVRHDVAREAFETNWEKLTVKLGLAGIELDEMSSWAAKREKALTAASALRESDDMQTLADAEVAEAKRALVATLTESGQQVQESDSLTVLCEAADSFIKSIEAENVKRETLSTQLTEAQTAERGLKATTDEALSEKQRWEKSWSDVLATAGLAEGSSTVAVEAALEQISDIETNLGKIRQIRQDRIATMRADLDEFAAMANSLALTLSAELSGEPAAAISHGLSKRLTKAQSEQTEAKRIAEALRIAGEQVDGANDSIRNARSTIKPLMERAGVQEPSQLADMITRSDERRILTAENAKVRSQVLEAADGLTLEQTASEVDAVNVATLAGELEALTAEYTEAGNRQAALTGELERARATLSGMGGSDAAAIAEAQRQEALSQMSDAAERYIRVFTAGRMLRWAIDRYREEKQGPMLARAGAIFMRLTKESFVRLSVNLDVDPPTLGGMRADGKMVEVAGMSDGTRDQLFLALRLAALEMHLDQAPPLPFIADDLFINFDDARAEAGFEALADLSEKTQVLYLSHHAHLIPTIRKVFGEGVNIVELV